MEGKKMGLNGLMNKISMGLKDAALQQGFEVICKRLAKLEKENEELKAKLYSDSKNVFADL